jgi:ribonucleotide reductase alpha subunit
VQSNLQDQTITQIRTTIDKYRDDASLFLGGLPMITTDIISYISNDLVHHAFEALQYYALKASNKLAKEKGRCPLFNETQYAKGILPIDTFKKEINDFCHTALTLDWDELRKAIKKDGLRNSTLTALMPCESSSQ